MSVPGRGLIHSRVANQENISLGLQRRTNFGTGMGARDAATGIARLAIHRVITVDSISHSTPGTCYLAFWNGTSYELAKDGNGDPVEIEVGGYLLNNGEDPIDPNTGGFAVHLEDNSWEWLSGNCDARDWELEGE